MIAGRLRAYFTATLVFINLTVVGRFTAPMDVVGDVPKMCAQRWVLQHPAGALISGGSAPEVDPKLSSVFLEKIGAGALARQSLTGEDVTLAVIDTGVDPSRFAPGVLSEWFDLTAEGVVITGGPYRITDERLHLDGMTLDVRAVSSRSGYLRAGWWSPSTLPEESPLRQALANHGPLAVVVVDRNTRGVYDTVYVDANQDGVISLEEELPLYRASGKYLRAYLSKESGRSLTLALAGMRGNGAIVVLGFDGHGHGTATASIVAGSQGGFRPISPEVTLLAIKVVDSTGATTWELVSRGINLAVELGADVILLSVAPRDRSGDSVQVSRLLESASHRSIIVMAAGNSGPGLGSLAAYAGVRGTLVVGGYLPVESQRILGITGDSHVFWPWSSCGPNISGATVDLVAPAVVPALLPAWASEKGVACAFEGTSAAAAVAAGAACLVVEAARKLGVNDIPASVARVLVETAERLEGLASVEQGAGALNVAFTVDLLSVLFTKGETSLVFKWDGSYQVGAFWDRSRIPGAVPFRLENLSTRPLFLRMEYPRWLALESEEFAIPAVGDRSSVLRFQPDTLSGLYSGYILGDDLSLGGIELRVPVTVVVPRECSENPQEIRVPLTTGTIRREYFRVPVSAETLKIHLEVGTTGRGQPRGRGTMFVYGPDGDCVYQGPWIGAGTKSTTLSCVIDLPAPGVWEVVVVTDPMSQLHGVTEQFFKLFASVGGMIAEEVDWHDSGAESGRGRVLLPSITFTNTGSPFSGRVFVSDLATTGFERKRLWISTSASTVESLPSVPEDAEFLYASLENPDIGKSPLRMYLYRYDPVRREWVEIAAAVQSSGRGRASVFIESPPPGEYVVYIEAPGDDVGARSAEWLAVVGGGAYGWQVECDKARVKDIKWWAWNETKRLDVDPTAPAGSPLPASLLLTIWDVVEGKLKAVVPLEVSPESQRPVISVLQGGGIGNLRFLTIKAWVRTTGKPVDACVHLGNKWYQLLRGETTVLVPLLQSGEVTEVSVYGQTFPIPTTAR